MIMGDWNAVVGECKEDKCIGHYGLGWQNDRGKKLVEFCKRRKLYVANTWFCHDKCRRYTWKSPADRGRFQIERPIHTSKTAKIILLGRVDRTNWLTNQFFVSTRPSKMIFAVLDVWIGRSYTVL